MQQRWWLPLLVLILRPAPGCHRLDDRPTAGGRPRTIAPSPTAAEPVSLVDVTAASGVRFRHHTGAFGRKWFPETNGSGAAIFDYDGDGLPDLFLVNGRGWSPTERRAAGLPPGRPPRPTPSALFRNRGGIHSPLRGGYPAEPWSCGFEDVTHAAGLAVPMYGMGCAVGDYDNDGYPDLYVSGIGRGWLFHNEGGRRFREVSAAAGVQGAGWGTSCAWVDVDRDGHLDLFVCHYVKWNAGKDAPCEGAGGRPVYCGPNLYSPEPCRLYHNRGDGTFLDVSQQSGIWGAAGRPLVSKALGVTVCDIDADGWPDLAVANDTEPNILFRNNHDSTFDERGLSTGMALPSSGTAQSGMGIDAGDWDGSGRDSLLIGNFWAEMLSLYHPDEHGFYSNQAETTGLGEASRLFTTFGCLFVDLDNDGWLDVAAVNGHIDRKMERGENIPWAQRPFFLMNQAGKRFREVHLYDRTLVGRGLAAGDWNRDGATDLLLTTNGGAPVLLQNVGGKGASLRLLLEGTRSNRSGIGAVVIARVGGRVLRRRARSGSSYLSASELALTLGLGADQRAERITVRWPSGSVDELTDLAAGNEYHVREGSGVVATLALPGRQGGGP
jgi:hypothetical protein